MAETNMLRMLLAQKNQTFLHAVELGTERHSAAFYKDLEKAGSALEEWASKTCFREGVNPIQAILEPNERDYRYRIGIGLFLEAEKYNDIRGWLLNIVEAAEAVKQENEILKASRRGHALSEVLLIDTIVMGWKGSKKSRQESYLRIRNVISFSHDYLDQLAEGMGLKVFDGEAD